jgi:methylated-DNA-protein-cysteine methyltransferase-like protein
VLPDDRTEWTAFEQAVGTVLDRLRPGDLVTYGDVAAEAGYPGAARAVGSILRKSGGIFPWWRVVSASGRLLKDHEVEQTERLTAEGVEVRDGRIRG